MADYATNFIAALIKEGLGPTAGLRAFREAGGQIRTQTWFRAWGEVVGSLAKHTATGMAPLDRRPTAEEISRWTTARRPGYLYQIEFQVRPRGTAEVWTSWHSVRSDRLLTYGDALAGSLDALATDLDAYDEIVLGGVVTGVFELTPEEAF